MKHGALPEERIHAVEIGVCPHGRILEDININLGPLEELCNLFKVDILLYEYGGGIFKKTMALSLLNTYICPNFGQSFHF